MRRTELQRSSSGGKRERENRVNTVHGINSEIRSVTAVRCDLKRNARSGRGVPSFILNKENRIDSERQG